MRYFKKSIKLFVVAFIAIFSITSVAIAADLPDYFSTDLAKAKEEAVAKNKKILVVFSAAWCGPCKQMEKKIYPLPKVKKGLADYICVYIDGDKKPNIVGEYKINAYPTFIVLDKDAKELGRVLGGKLDPDAFLKSITDTVNKKSNDELEVAVLDKNIKESPTAENYIKRGNFRETKDDARAAIADYKEAAKLDKDDELQIQGNILYIEYRTTKASDKECVVLLEKIVKDYPKCAQMQNVQLELLSLYEILQMSNKAIEIGNAFLEQYPDHPDAKTIQAYVMFKQIMGQAAASKDLNLEKPQSNAPKELELELEKK